MSRYSVAHTALFLGAALLAGVPAIARADLLARFDYSVPDRFEVPDPDPEGVDGEVYTEQFTHPATWHVDFDACASEPQGTIVEYRWSIDGSPEEISETCDGFSHEFLEEDEYTVRLTVVDDEEQEDTYTRQVIVQDWLIFGLGDSYGSGEGNPDVPISIDPALFETWETALATAQAEQQDYLDTLEQLGVTEADLEAVQDEVDSLMSAWKTYDECPNPIECAQAFVDFSEASDTLISALAALGLDLDGGAIWDIATSLGALGDAQILLAAAWEALTADVTLTPTWQNRRCHRSQFSGQVQAAQALEASDPHTSVTFVHLACSGATIDQGLLGPYEGVENGGDPIPAQIDEAKDIAGGRQIDMVLLSIGGNDVHFSTVIETCMVGETCYEENPEPQTAVIEGLEALCDAIDDLIPDCHDYITHIEGTTVQNASDVFYGGLATLPAGYDALAAEINTELGLIDPSRVFLTEYPDLTRDENGAYCEWNPDEPLSSLPGLSLAEWTWVDAYAATDLRAAMQSAAADHGWTFVSGIAEPFGTHGYCAADNWLVRIQESFLQQGDVYGTMHPNEDGHEIYRDAIAAALPVPEPSPALSARVALLVLALMRARRRRGR